MTQEAKLVSWFLIAASAAVLGSAVSFTYAIAGGAPAALRLPFRLICHGLPERAFVLAGTPMPICSRCVALWAGLIVGAVIFLLLWRAIGRFPLGALFVLVVPLAVDGLTQAMGIRESTNMLRAMTGLVAGTAFAAWALSNLQAAAVERLKSLKIESVTPP